MLETVVVFMPVRWASISSAQLNGDFIIGIVFSLSSLVMVHTFSLSFVTSFPSYIPTETQLLQNCNAYLQCFTMPVGKRWVYSFIFAVFAHFLNTWNVLFVQNDD